MRLLNHLKKIVYLAVALSVLWPSIAMAQTASTDAPPVCKKLDGAPRQECLTQNDIDDILNNTPYYSSTADDCSLTGGTTFAVSVALPDTVPEPFKSLFTQAATAFNTSATYIAALYMDENGNTWKDFNTAWATSPDGAKGPMQFMPITWGGYQVDGNNDGVKDINNMYDAVYSAANMAAKNGVQSDSPLGDINAPFKRTTPKTMLIAAAAYNWGGGNVDKYTTDTTSIDDPLFADHRQAQDYVKNTYAVVSSGFTKSGKAGYADPHSAGTPASGEATSGPVMGCSTSSGVVAGNLVTTAVNLAWDHKLPTGSKDRSDAKPSYQDAMPKYNGSVGNDEFSDCGVFVSTALIASQADQNYPRRGTGGQLDYLRSHPEKYIILDNITNTSQLLPGDVFVYNDGAGGHTFIYTGPLANGFNGVDASWHDHVPQVKKINAIDPQYTVARLK